MKNSERSFDYADLLECIDFLGSRAYGKPLAYLISLVGYYVVDRDLRQMLNYLVRRGRLERREDGGDPRYLLRGPRSGSNIVEMKTRKSRARWQGAWHVFTYDMPVSHNAMRRKLAVSLHEMGFAMLCASTWISPYNWEHFLGEILSDPLCEGSFYHLNSAAVRLLPRGTGGELGGLWDLHKAKTAYRAIANQCAKATTDEGTSAAKKKTRTLLAVRRNLRLVERWDPMLPAQLLPHDWPRDQALKNAETLRSMVEHSVRSAPLEVR